MAFETRLYSEGLKALAFPAQDRLIALQHYRSVLDWRPKDDPELQSPVNSACDWRLLVSDRRQRIHATRSHSGRIDVWDSAAPDENAVLGKRIATIALAADCSPGEMVLSRDGSQLFVEQTGLRDELQVYSTRTGEVEASLPFAMSGSTGCAALSTNGRLAMRIDDDLLLWSFAPSGAGRMDVSPAPNSPAALRRLKRVHRLPTCLAFSPDDALLVTGGLDRKIKFWDPATGELLATLSGHRGGIESLAFSHDGRTLLSAGADGKVKAWSVAARKEIFDLLDDGHNTQAMQLSPNGRWLGAIRDNGFRLSLLDLGAAIDNAP
jgi:WD40 repeat protein